MEEQSVDERQGGEGIMAKKKSTLIHGTGQDTGKEVEGEEDGERVITTRSQLQDNERKDTDL